MKSREHSAAGRTQRRDFLKRVGTGALALALPGATRARPASPPARPEGANGDVRVAIVGIGSKEAVGGVGGRGHQLIDSLRKVPGTRIVALCDVDRDHLQRKAAELKDQGIQTAQYSDLRRVCDDKDIDAVVVATPNHWHALATIWACQAGKDVYVEKPVSHNIWEGRQMVAAARKYGRVVQAGTQARSSPVLREAHAWLERGELGALRFARIVLYRQRAGIGRSALPNPAPAGVDYDLWCGPAEKVPLRRKQLHYDWHWVWSTGSGEMGNNGVHYLDMCRWMMKLGTSAPRVVSVGGRFGFEDDGETPNTQVACFDFSPAPIYCEIRGLPDKAGSKTMDSFRGTSVGMVLEFDGGSLAGAHLNATASDREGRVIRKFGPAPWGEMDGGHLANFIAAVRRRRPDELHAEILEGHLSAACCHQANISHRLGRAGAGEPAGAALAANPVLADALARYREHLRANAIEFVPRQVTGPLLTFDVMTEQFVGDRAADANRLLTREYRPPFVVPSLA